MSRLDPYKNLDDYIEILLEAQEFDDAWIETSWITPPSKGNISEVRRSLKRNLKKRYISEKDSIDNEESNYGQDQLDGVAWYVKD